jgi:hypothetical protein
VKSQEKSKGLKKKVKKTKEPLLPKQRFIPNEGIAS